MSEEAYVKKNIEKEIATIEFYHPAHNSLPGNILSKLADTITETGKDDTIKVIVLKSGGSRTFCAGASFQELIAIDNEKDGKAFFMGFANVINAMRKCPKFIIGRVQGKAVGGGVGVASAMDFCMATKFASIKLSELNLGIGPFVVGPAVQRKLGTGMSQIAIDANEFYSAEWARTKGLYAKVFDDNDQLNDAIEKLAKQLCGYNPEAVKEMKTMFWDGTDNWDDLLENRAAISGRLVLSSFTKEKLKKYQ